jgi:DNA-binding NarL/FixJ family response regulator
MEKIRVLLAEDHTLVRAAIKSLLHSFPDVEVVGEASDGEEALRLTATRQPGVVLMDIAMSGMNGLQATAQLLKEFPNVRVIILSMHANEVYVLQALRAGASGYLLKDAGPEELESAIRAVEKGEVHLSPSVSKYVVADYVRRMGSAHVGSAEGEANAHDQLTPRQREILQLIATGHSTQEIANILFISGKTVETHRAQLMERLAIHDVAGLIRYAIRMGLVTSDA